MCFFKRKKRVNVSVESSLSSVVVISSPQTPPPPIRIPKTRVKFTTLSSRNVRAKRNDKSNRKLNTR